MLSYSLAPKLIPGIRLKGINDKNPTTMLNKAKYHCGIERESTTLTLLGRINQGIIDSTVGSVFSSILCRIYNSLTQFMLELLG